MSNVTRFPQTPEQITRLASIDANNWKERVEKEITEIYASVDRKMLTFDEATCFSPEFWLGLTDS